MKHNSALIFVAALGVAALGCEVEQQEQQPPVAEEVEAEPMATPDEATASATLRVDSLDGVGPYITDGEGRAVYAIEGAPEGQSTCYDACAEAWPPVLAPQGQPMAGAAEVQSDLLGTLQREDGQRQVTYAGHALYYYQEDQGPGEAEGQDVTDAWGEWYLVRPNGDILEGHAGGQSGQSGS